MQKTFHFWPYGLTKSTVIVCSLAAILKMGLFGLTGCGLAPEFTESTKANKVIVLAAAPFKTTRIGVEIEALTRLKAPPEYSNVTFLKTQSLQSNPSSGWMTFINDDEETTLPRNEGNVGSAPSKTIPLWADAGCTRIDVWFPNKNITKAPTINDPNATVILDITPPLENKESDCVIYYYHYGDPPPKQTERSENGI